MKKAILLVLIPALLLLVFVSARPRVQASPVADLRLYSPVATAPPIAVYYLGEEGAVRQALTLTPAIRLVQSPDEAQVIVANGPMFTRTDLRLIPPALQAGKGLVLILGEPVEAAALTGLLGVEVTTQKKTDAVSLVAVPNSDPLIRQVTWNSAPQVRERTALGGLRLEPLVQVYQSDDAPARLTSRNGERAGASDEIVLGRLSVGQAPVYVFTPWLATYQKEGQATLANPQMRDWPYFNYLIYSLALRAAGATPLSYADYPASPVPHASDRLLIAGLVTLLLLGNTLIFLWVRRYSRRHPEALEHLVASPETYRRAQKVQWEEVGFQRPLVGFLVLLTTGLLMFVPLMIYQTAIFSGIILPSSQARGAWSIVTNIFQFVWVLFDMGTSTAFVKFFSQYRINDPQKGVKYVQFYVWWQAITGTIQVAVVALAATILVPQMPVAYMAFYIVVHALIQFPGFLRVFQYLLRALQRTDYDQVLNIMATPLPNTMGILVILIQPLAVLGMRAWGAAHPAFGEMMGGVFGLSAGFILVELSFFLLSFWLYRRLGYQARVVFMANFDLATAKEALLFGLPLTLAGLAGSFGYTVQVSLTAAFLINYAEIQGNWDVAFGLIIAYGALGGFYQNLMPAVSEAFSHGKLALTRYYIAQAWKYGGWFSAFIGSALLGVTDRFIIGSLGQEWVRAAEISTVLILWGAVQFPAWFADRLQEGTNHPWMQFIMLAIEQSIRIILMFVLLQRFQLLGLILAYCVALPTKDVLVWLWNYFAIMRFRIHWWQTIFAPLLAGIVNLLALRLVGNLIWQPNMVASIVLFLVGILCSLPFFSFWSGFFGGWDAPNLLEVKRAAEMSPVGKPVGYLIYYPASWGARLSPLHNRFPIPCDEALTEAKVLTAEKVSLV